MYAATLFVNGERQLEGFLASKKAIPQKRSNTLVTVAPPQRRTLIAVVMKPN
jgi:hypothetical protein